jgi:hypothetical protein
LARSDDEHRGGTPIVSFLRMQGARSYADLGRKRATKEALLAGEE